MDKRYSRRWMRELSKGTTTFGTLLELCVNMRCRVRLDSGKDVSARLSSKTHQREFIRYLPGDRVVLQASPRRGYVMLGHEEFYLQLQAHLFSQTSESSELTQKTQQLDPVRTLTKHAEKLNRISTPGWWPKITYEILSSALVWSDETNKLLPMEVFQSLRYIVAYRTSLMLNSPREEFKPLWELGLKLFPNWVGFRPERREPTPKLLEIYRRGDVSLRKCLRDWERERDNKKSSDNP